LRLVIVPRHAERFEAVAAWLALQGEPVLRRSANAAAPTPDRSARPPVILIDTIGELSSVWGLADVAYVGGSLRAGRGGQNMMEPAAFGAAVLFGPHTENFRETVEHLLARDGARRVADAAGLAAALRDDLDDPESAAARGAAGRAYVLAQNGAADRTLVELDRLVELAITAKAP
jgi:3-deoxy-D-manno-octulosonic-acid transferase